MASNAISVVVPTYQEAENLSALVARLEDVRTKHGLELELILSDDNSRDDSVEIVARLGRPWVRILARSSSRGEGPAVLDGLKAAQHDRLVVMKADLSHPPEKIPELLAALDRGADFVIGSRYVHGGSTDVAGGPLRRLHRLVVTGLTRPFTSAADPKSGFFALDRKTFEAARELDPIGDSIGLELLVKCGCRRIVEVPIHFIDRMKGERKFTLKDRIRGLAHLRRLTVFKYPGCGTAVLLAGLLLGEAVLLAAFFKIGDLGFGRAGLALLTLPPLLLLAHAPQRAGRFLRLLGTTLALIAIFAGSVRAAIIVRNNIRQPEEWDFTLYWLYGQALNRGMNPYDPSVLPELARPLNPSTGLANELICIQLPPTLLLFLPLGAMGIREASAGWNVLLLIALAADIVLLWRQFLRHTWGSGFLLTATLVLTLRSTISTLHLSQVNFFVLLFLLLFWKDRERARGGAWLAVALLIKPALLVLPLFLLVRRRWSVLGAMAATIGVFSLVTIVLLGPSLFLGYFTSNPITRQMPSYLYTETVNQSLLATTLRLTGFDLSRGSPYFHPPFLILAVACATGVVALLRKLDPRDDEWGVAMTVVLALLLFPKTLEHYSVLLLVPSLLVWSRRSEFPGGAAGAFAFIVVSHGLVAFGGGELVFLAFAFQGLLLAACAVHRIRGRSPRVLTASDSHGPTLTNP